MLTLKRAVVAVRRELEDALARADGLSALLQVSEAKWTKAEEAAKASVEAFAVHLGQLQEVQAQRISMSFPFLCFLFLFVSLLRVLDFLVPMPLCAVQEEIEKELAATRESSMRVGGASEELWVVLDPNASPAAHLAAVMAVGREWIQ